MPFPLSSAGARMVLIRETTSLKTTPFSFWVLVFFGSLGFLGTSGSGGGASSSGRGVSWTDGTTSGTMVGVLFFLSHRVAGPSDDTLTTCVVASMVHSLNILGGDFCRRLQDNSVINLLELGIHTAVVVSINFPTLSCIIFIPLYPNSNYFLFSLFRIFSASSVVIY